MSIGISSGGGFFGGYTCAACQKYVPSGTTHQCSGFQPPASAGVSWTITPQWGAVYFQKMIDLLTQIAGLLQPQELEATLEVAGASVPPCLHLRGERLTQTQVDALRTQLDEYASGRDTRPLVINYSGEVAWLTPPERA